jgi:hypothetical protein
MSQFKIFDRVRYATLFWGFTALIAPIVIVLTALAYFNPFWFRDAGFDFAESVVYSMTRFRNKLVQPIIDKYRTFEILKGA